MAEKRGKAALFNDDEFNVEETVQDKANEGVAETKPHAQTVTETQTHNADTQPVYTMEQEETRSKRIQIVIKPSINKELDKLVRQKKIKSKNDLVNFLLESFVEQNR